LTPQAGISGQASPLALEENTESFFESLSDPQRGQVVPFQSVERTNTSLSCPHFSQ
jgi:hypothetical protein